MLLSAGVGLVVSAISAAVLQLLAKRMRIVRKVGIPLANSVNKGRPLPPIGGIALASGIFAGVAHWHFWWQMPWSPQAKALVFAGLIILAVGLVDDFFRELTPWQKLLGQGLAWFALLQGGIVTEIVMLSPGMNVLVSLLWTLTIVNAVNLLDIVDGLAIGVGLIAACAFLVLAILSGQSAVASLLAVLAASLAGVLMFNYPRATLFLGDSGSMLLGLLLASLSVAVRYAPIGREVALLTPVIVLGLPLYDVMFVALIRMRNNRSPIMKSQDHFVLRLIRRGRPAWRAVAVMFVLAMAFGAVAVIISRSSNAVGASLLGLLAVLCGWWAVRVAKVPSI